MKIKNLFRVTTMLIITSLVIVTISNCNKTNPGAVNMENPSGQTGLIEKSKAMQEHILAFKAKMEYYRDNPSLKTGGELYTADSAVLELESLLNYNFCYTDIGCNKKTFVTSEITMPLDELEKINDPKLMEVYYDKVIDTIQTQMGRVDYENMKLLLVDLEVTGTDSNGDAIVSVKALIGNQGSISVTNADGWIYGYFEGSCDGTLGVGVTDAALYLELELLFGNIPSPPPGKKRCYVEILTTGILDPQGYYFDPNDLDNYLDSQIFYATEAVEPIVDSVRCLSNDIEIPFYLDQYDSLIVYFEDYHNLDFVECTVQGYTPSYDEPYIQHNYEIVLGNVWYIDDCVMIDDILHY